jgi:hypothetical protein
MKLYWLPAMQVMYKIVLVYIIKGHRGWVTKYKFYLILMIFTCICKM